MQEIQLQTLQGMTFSRYCQRDFVRNASARLQSAQNLEDSTVISEFPILQTVRKKFKVSPSFVQSKVTIVKLTPTRLCLPTRVSHFITKGLYLVSSLFFSKLVPNEQFC